jgi:D-alanyl-D-alanine carboxypeptidase
MNRRPTTLRFAALTFAAALHWTAALADKTTDSIDSIVKSAMEKRHIPGISVAVMKEGRPVYVHGYGLANVELTVPATPATVYEIGSITKQFTATTVMMLVEEGKIALDDSINKYLDGLPEAWNSVTIRHLLTHTSGIKSYTNLPSFLPNLRKDYKPEEIPRLSYEIPLEFQPGERFAYNNTGYFLLGMILEKVSGKPYGELLHDRIFSPLGMTSTRINSLRDVIPNRASGYDWSGTGYKNAEYLSMTQPGGAGVLVSTVLDMAKWDAALYGERLLKKSSLQQMWTPFKLNTGTMSNYGFGWGITHTPAHRGIAHGGGIPGFTTDIRRLLDDKLTVVVFTNSGVANPGSIAQSIAELYVPAVKPPPVKVVTGANPALTARLRALFAGVIRGDAAPSDFSPQMQRLLFGPEGDESRKDLRSMGALKSFDLISQRADGANCSLLYRAVLGTTTVEVACALNEDGKVIGLGVRPAD